MVLLSLRAVRYIFITSIIWFGCIAFIIYYYLGFQNKTFEEMRTSFPNTGYNAEYERLKKTSDLRTWNLVPRKESHHRHHGEYGNKVKVPKDKMEQVHKTFIIHRFNLVASDMVPLNRTLKDIRPEECRSKIYPKYLPSTSVIIIFRNEAWSTLLRTVWSVINRSPKELLEEIILVDDASDLDHLGIILEHYISLLPVPVHLFRTVIRQGLVRSRLLGAKNAKGATLTFLDSHCECEDGWLEPLLSRIAENRKVVICPVIDTISDEDFSFRYSKKDRGGFNWRLLFRWFSLTTDQVAEAKMGSTMPWRSPAMAGGLFTIDRDYFYEIGSYDEDMEIWGSENIEMSLRIWQCGGILEVSRCSRVGHVFRKTSPHTFPDGISKTIKHNVLRIVEVWLDEWKYFYYAINAVDRNASYGDVSSRIKLRKDLKCKSFGWFLHNIFPESAMLYNATYLGEIRSVGSKKCLEVNKIKGKNKLLHRKCNRHYTQGFMLTEYGQIVSLDYCLDCKKKNGIIDLYVCHGLKGNQEFFYNNSDQTIMHVGFKQCIQNFDKSNPTFPILRECNSSNPNQKWILKNDYKWKEYMQNYKDGGISTRPDFK